MVAFDSMHFSEGALQFVLGLHQLAPVTVSGVFLPHIDFSDFWSYTASSAAGPVLVPPINQPAIPVESKVSRFEAFCLAHHIPHKVSKHLYDYTLAEIKQETRYCDLLVIGSEAFYSNTGELINEQLQDILRHAECPVILVPENFEFPGTNILMYDGSASSVFAIKQFSYLFPEFTGGKTLIVYVDKDPEAEMPDKQQIRDLACRHYDQCGYFTLKADNSNELAGWIGEQKGSIMVSGAFGRSSLSQLFKRSFAYKVIMEHRMPVFIAHK